MVVWYSRKGSGLDNSLIYYTVISVLDIFFPDRTENKSNWFKIKMSSQFTSQKYQELGIYKMCVS